ncbi:MAG: nucleoside triphosphate pyrophosphohydrolase [Alphaproteobacteria bacterium]|nr:nucleoside triphosphate pyrophosphohydrolase [Alphaproteobacteria bacterium]PHX98516.1 MAG: nucleoside triphosphate pyrophosphohydrolase [Rhodospirillaceae bacterium]
MPDSSNDNRPLNALPDGSTGDIADLIEVMARLRAPEVGCPWDIEQTFATIAPYTIEEAYEVADAIARGDMASLKDELGDLLLQSVYHARMAEEAGHFKFEDVVAAICAKMIRRHPHVFGDEVIATVGAQNSRWEEHKAAERADKKAASGNATSVLDDIPATLPAMKHAEKLQKRAARVGFDWPDATQVLDKIDEEIGEIKEAMAANAGPERITDEIGDLLFACVNLARKANIDPGMALRGTSLKFERRFRRIEELLSGQGKTPAQANLDEMETFWRQAKDEEKT